MSYPFYMTVFAALLFGGTALKNKVEDEVLVESDGFTRFDGLFQRYASLNGLPWTWVKAIAMNESSLGTASSVATGLTDPSDVEGSKSSDGKSWGLMQMTLPTAGDEDPMVTPQKLNDPEYSIRLACQFLKKLYKKFGASEEWVIKSYNQGAGNSVKEINGEISGYAEAYWERYQRNRRLILEKQGE